MFLQHSIRKTRGGFTLVELLMSISIIAILSTLAIAVLRSAEDDARASRTRSVLANVRTVIQRRMEAYETRRLPFRFADVGIADYADMDHVRKRVLAEWFRAEMPTNVVTSANTLHFPNPEPGSPVPDLGDLQVYPSAQTRAGGAWPNSGLPVANGPPMNGGGAENSPEILALSDRLALRPPAMLTRLRRHFQMTVDASGVWSPPITFDPLYQDAECLYAILNNSWDGDRRGTHFLSPSEIGDTDNDGFLEVLDGWGDPLVFRIEVPRDSNGDGIVDNTDNRRIHPDPRMQGMAPQTVLEFDLNDYQIAVDSVNPL